MSKPTHNAGFLKRLMVMVYDGLLLIGVTLVGYSPLFAIFAFLPDGFGSSSIGTAIKVTYLLVIPYLFYAWFWIHGGQTLGMKAWNIYLTDNQGQFISWQRALVRYFAAAISWGSVAGVLYLVGIERWYLTIGIGFVWILVDKRNLAWHDLISDTRMVQMPKGIQQTATKS